MQGRPRQNRYGAGKSANQGISSDHASRIRHDLTDEERALFGTYDVAADLAARCRRLREMNVSVSGDALDRVVNRLMTEFWDQSFSQTEIRRAFTAALADMNRYAAGEERR